MKEVLSRYERASGQLVNLNKSSLYFSKNTDLIKRGEVCLEVGVEAQFENGLYLGLPDMVGRNRKEVFRNLKEKLWRKMQGWERVGLSRVAKEILLKTVAQALPNYTMGVFQFALSLCDDIEKSMNRFWWRNRRGNNKGVHWLSWERLCRLKGEGGLGFCKVHDMNVALLARAGWKLLTLDKYLLVRIYKARYYPKGTFFTATLGHNPSFVWRSVMAAQGLVQQGSRVRVGRGNSIKIWTDPWLISEDSPVPSTPCPAGLEEMTVEQLKWNGNDHWNLDLLAQPFNQRDQQSIRSIPISASQIEDKWYWKADRSGQYKSKAGYRAQM